MSDKCINLDDINQNLGCSGGNMSGIIPSITFGYWEDVATWPDEPAPVEVGGVITPLELEAAGKLIGDVIMKNDTRAFKMDFTEETGSFTINAVGEIDGGQFEHNLTLVKAKINQKILGFMNAAVGRRMFFIVEDSNGIKYLMGSKKRKPVFVTGGENATTGTTSSDRNQATIQFRYTSPGTYSYEGDTEDILVAVPAP
jgi:hypothetical protein